MMKKVLALLLTGALAFGVIGCGNSGSDDTVEETNVVEDAVEGDVGNMDASQWVLSDPVTIVVGASPTPHAEVLYAAQATLEERGVILRVMEFTDYVQPNLALDGGDLDANYFQHVPYLDSFNSEYGTNAVAVGMVHYEPMGIYSEKLPELAYIQEGAKVGIPADGTNGGRALLLLQDAGLILLNENAGISATKLDIKENPFKLEIMEMEAAQIALSLSDLDLGVINGNYAMQNGLSPADALVAEGENSVAANTYGNIVAVKAGDESRVEIQILMDVLNSDEIADYIEATYNGAVMPKTN